MKESDSYLLFYKRSQRSRPSRANVGTQEASQTEMPCKVDMQIRDKRHNREVIDHRKSTDSRFTIFDSRIFSHAEYAQYGESDENRKSKIEEIFSAKKFGVPYEIRTRVYSVKGSCPRPLDEGDREKKLVTRHGFEPWTLSLKGRCSTAELTGQKLRGDGFFIFSAQYVNDFRLSSEGISDFLFPSVPRRLNTALFLGNCLKNGV